MLLLLLLLSTADCTRCHEQQAQQHSLSRHALAGSNPTFAVSFAERRLPWCLSCHAPSGDRVAGVTCADCHLDDVVGDPQEHKQKQKQSPPAASSCARCHEVVHPDSKAVLQSTIEEHRASRFASTPCTGCHMREAGHRFPGARDAQMLRRAFSFAVVDVGGEGVVVRVSSHGVGHRAPTGDPFRRLRLRLCQDVSCKRVLATATRGRVLEGQRFVVDEWLPPPTRDNPDPFVDVALHLSQRPPAGAVVVVSFVYADPRHLTLLPRDERELEIARLELP